MARKEKSPMFKNEFNGYNREEVDQYITRLKAELMQQKFSLLESEKKCLDAQKQKEEVETKEKNILKAIQVFEDARKFQEEGSKSIYALKIEQMTLVYRKFEDVLKKIYYLHPELERDNELGRLVSELDEVLESAKGETVTGILTSPVNSDNDSMRVLLGKMQEYRKNSENPREVRIARINVKKQPESEISTEENGFDLKEAVNPKLGLEEIMKAFDFFNNTDEN